MTTITVVVESFCFEDTSAVLHESKRVAIEVIVEKYSMTRFHVLVKEPMIIRFYMVVEEEQE